MYELNYYIDYIKDQLTVYGLLETELSDDAWSKIVSTAMQELLRYYDQTALIEVPAASCIDLKKLEEDAGIKISSVSQVYRTEALMNFFGQSSQYPMSSGSWPSGMNCYQNLDPMWLGFWQNGYGYNTTNWMYSYLNYVNLNRLRGMNSPDLDFREDQHGRKLYINFSNSIPATLTIEYVPRLTNVDEITGDYWVDIMKRLSLAYAKIAVGRARTRFQQSSALWTDDGATILQEGTTELQALRERLQANADFMYPVD